MFKVIFFSLIIVCNFLPNLRVHAGDYRNTMPERLMSPQGLLPSSDPRTSPFEPPTGDAFIADGGSGLDTGCTFNDDPEHPLLIDILVHRYVGEVDANGFLINPQPLIDKGIIPSQVLITMPAYDVDLDGEPIPERDDVLFNGENLGSLIGADGVWEYNAFLVDITKVKFPAKPAEGSLPTPVENWVQINVDVLGDGDWCTSIDWVALQIPIRHRFALTLKPLESNYISGSNGLIDTIYKQTFDAECNLIEEIGAIEKYPFSGTIASKVQLVSELEPCPKDTSVVPKNKVKINWKIPSASPPLQEEDEQFGNIGYFFIDMPEQIGVYDVNLEYIVDDEFIELSRRLFVTKTTPLYSEITIPERSWYEKATTWASGEQDEEGILAKLLNGLYKFGNANWRYGYYFFSPLEKCDWEQLVANPIACDYADCHVFSEIFKNMAYTLGIKDLAYMTPEGSYEKGFITKSFPSIDPSFDGNAGPLLELGYDRYVFSKHRVIWPYKKGGFYYDATFNGIYVSLTDFIAYNLDGGQGTDTIGQFYTTAEGVRLYPLNSSHYDSWEDYGYIEAGPLLQSPFIKRGIGGKIDIADVDIRFPNDITFRAVDEDSNGFAEALIADIPVELLTAGTYGFTGSLQKEGQAIAIAPAFSDTRLSSTTISEKPGIYTVPLKFSGEQIFQTGENGPYELKLMVGNQNGGTIVPSAFTEPYDYRQFGELDAVLTGTASDRPVDENGDGKFDFLEITVGVEVRTVGKYLISVLGTWETFDLIQEKHNLKLKSPGYIIRREGLNGSSEELINLFKTSGDGSKDREYLDQFIFNTSSLNSDDFDTLLAFTGTFNEQGVDTNNNGLFNSLRVSFGVDITEAGRYFASARLIFGQTSVCHVS